jgi:hypothetical protein
MQFKILGIFLLPFLSRSIEMVDNPFYLKCDDIPAQNDYIQQERREFAIADDISAFSANLVYNDIPEYFPSACRDSLDNYYKPVSYPKFILKNPALKITDDVKRIKYFDNAVYNFIDWFWQFTQWQHITVEGEHYMYYNNSKTDNIVFYFHGVNALNGLENLYLMRKLTNQASVYIMLYTPLFIFDTNNGYNFTFYERILNVKQFIYANAVDRKVPFVLMGNSFGTIQITCLCKQFPTICRPASKIILTDPILLNLPFSRTLHAVTFGVFMYHDQYSKSFQGIISVINVIRQTKYYNLLLNWIDWHEWSVDSTFIRVYSDQLVLVIGKYDRMINVTQSPIFEHCRVIFTETRHGMVIFDNFLQSVDLWTKSCDLLQK